MSDVMNSCDHLGYGAAASIFLALVLLTDGLQRFVLRKYKPVAPVPSSKIAAFHWTSSTVFERVRNHYWRCLRRLI